MYALKSYIILTFIYFMFITFKILFSFGLIVEVWLFSVTTSQDEKTPL